MAFSWFSVPQRGHLMFSRVYSPSASFLLQFPHRIVSTGYALCVVAFGRRRDGGGALAERRRVLREVAGGSAATQPLVAPSLFYFWSQASSSASAISRALGARFPVSSIGMNLRDGMLTFFPRPALPPYWWIAA